MARKLTTIDVHSSVAREIHPILEAEGFTVGTTGSGRVEFERDGLLSEDKKQDLITRMAVIVFAFDEQDLDDDEDPGYKEPCHTTNYP